MAKRKADTHVLVDTSNSTAAVGTGDQNGISESQQQPLIHSESRESTSTLNARLLSMLALDDPTSPKRMKKSSAGRFAVELNLSRKLMPKYNALKTELNDFWQSEPATIRDALGPLSIEDRRICIKHLLTHVRDGTVQRPTFPVIAVIQEYPSIFSDDCFIHPIVDRYDLYYRSHTTTVFHLFSKSINRHFLNDVIQNLLENNDSETAYCYSRCNTACRVIDVEQILYRWQPPLNADDLLSKVVYCWEVLVHHASKTPLYHYEPLVQAIYETVRFHRKLPCLLLPTSAATSTAAATATALVSSVATTSTIASATAFASSCSVSSAPASAATASLWCNVYPDSEVQYAMPTVLVQLTLAYVLPSVQIPDDLIHRLQNVIRHLKSAFVPTQLFDDILFELGVGVH